MTIAKVVREVPDIVSEDIQRLHSIFPHVVIEGKIDFERLRTTLGNLVDSSPERFTFSWAGKRDALQIIQMPTRATLIPIKDESVDFNTTKNIFIEGDNLEVLKLLHKAYFGKIKVIYIDPPYNTGEDFIYSDNYSDPLDTYLKITGQKNPNGDLLTSNPETSGRFHSAWLSMMYPRLYLARQFLTEDGFIFVSIDDNEVHNLRLIMNEIFGEENFIASYIWEARSGKGATAKLIANQHEYVLCYARDIKNAKLRQDIRETKGGNFEDKKSCYTREQLRQWGQGDRRSDRPTMWYPVKAPDGTVVYPIKDDGTQGRWRISQVKMNKLIKDDDVDFVRDGNRYQLYRKIREGTVTKTAMGSFIFGVGTASTGTIELKSLFKGKKVYDTTKPLGLIKYIVNLVDIGKDATVLDFFAGSATTAHAILELNESDKGNRKFICVQLPENIQKDTEAYKEGFRTISEIGEERIRRAISQLKHKGNRRTSNMKDCGFKVFKLAESNYKLWKGVKNKTPERYAREMETFIDSLVKGWTGQNVIYEVAIKEGFGLTSSIECEKKYKHNEIWRVTDDDRHFFICLDDKIKHSTIRSLEISKDEMFICREIALDDTCASNLASQCRLKAL